jgi:hypothetical protein
VSTGRFSISYPSDWRQTTTAQHDGAALKLSGQIALVPGQDGGGALIVGTATATDSALLPQGFAATLLSPPQSAPVKLGSSVYRRYLNLLPRDASAPETVYALPTTAGTVIASCVAPAADATVFASACEHAVASLHLRAATALPLTASPGFARSLGAIIGTLNASRAADGGRLASAKHPADQASAARRLASDHVAAAAAAARLQPGPVGADANQAIVAALRKLGSGYTLLARAADHADKRGYAAATAAINQADAALAAGFARLRQDGYSIG